MNEIWKDINRYVGYYKISNKGRIRSLKRKAWNGYDNINIKERIMKSYQNNSGYPCVHLSKNGNIKCYLVHRLVADSFISNDNNKLEVNHLNGIKTDNNVKNLEWCTKKENERHAWDNKMKKPYWENKKNPHRQGEKHYFAKLSENDVLAIHGLYQTSEFTQQEVGLLYNISRRHTQNIIHGRRWNYLY